MHIPKDKPLDRWICELIKDGKLYRFYKTDEWLSLRERILRQHHNECAWCDAEGRYARAVTVHHINEVKDAPSLALSETYRDDEGKTHPNLVPLCAKCHNKAHGRFQGAKKRTDKQPLTEERW